MDISLNQMIQLYSNAINLHYSATHSTLCVQHLICEMSGAGVGFWGRRFEINMPVDRAGSVLKPKRKLSVKTKPKPKLGFDGVQLGFKATLRNMRYG